MCNFNCLFQKIHKMIINLESGQVQSHYNLTLSGTISVFRRFFRNNLR